MSKKRLGTSALHSYIIFLNDYYGNCLRNYTERIRIRLKLDVYYTDHVFIRLVPENVLFDVPSRLKRVYNARRI